MVDDLNIKKIDLGDMIIKQHSSLLFRRLYSVKEDNLSITYIFMS